MIKTLRVADQRLEELTGGAVDTVTDRGGSSYQLRRAQNESRRRESARHAAILDALPAHILLLDPDGVIVSVNEAWRQLADSNVLKDSAYGVGVNYLAICDGAWGSEAACAHAVAKGILSVLRGEIKRFSIEYPCDTPGGRVWFLLKIDRLFVSELATTAESNVLVAMIINLAHSLRLNVVAEGVETDGQSGILASMGCDQAQGFLYSKPVPGEIFSERLLTFRIP